MKQQMISGLAAFMHIQHQSIFCVISSYIGFGLNDNPKQEKGGRGMIPSYNQEY